MQDQHDAFAYLFGKLVYFLYNLGKILTTLEKGVLSVCGLNLLRNFPHSTR
ncbi:hypothetical protein KL86SPO_30376 [uncultured Sporomusa sp.]|uniref:Uncharacterized protein n=1 Tax=uncultured Sporomusa sp. TaxID=307249 RepID=A0A212LRL2_9FIRM|nr:hypothetical protein KL86SPO_30376 [uncultured Sporomusa sp.]